MPESTINPARVTLRKVDSGHRLYLYFRTNPIEIQIELIAGESATLYRYDEDHVAIPLPDIGVDLSDASERLSDQATLKQQVRQAFLSSASFRQELKNALAQALSVDREDNLSGYAGPAPVDLVPRHNWAEALCIILAPQDVNGITTEIAGEYKQLVDVGDYRLWSINAPVETLVSLHEELWLMAPVETLGVLAAVGVLDESFLPWAVVDNTSMTQRDAADRRDRIANYLENRGLDVTELREATNEHELIEGLVAALGYTMDQLWNAIQ